VGGLRELSVRKLARAAGTSTAAVYSLFGGKPGLIKALYSDAFARFGAAQRAVPVTDDPMTDIVNLGVAYRGSAISDPNGYHVMFGGVIRPSDVDPDTAQTAGRTFEPLVGAVQRAIDAGALPATHTAASIATALWANLHGLVTLEVGGFLPPLAVGPAEIFDASVRANLMGWANTS
jgi:AcrR family transcriptional regulator